MISRLRTKIKSLEDTELDIKAVRGVGYQLCATLQITHT
jgi:DNA-binding response OmpR family regulator